MQEIIEKEEGIDIEAVDYVLWLVEGCQIEGGVPFSEELVVFEEEGDGAVVGGQPGGGDGITKQGFKLSYAVQRSLKQAYVSRETFYPINSYIFDDPAILYQALNNFYIKNLNIFRRCAARRYDNSVN